MDQYERRYTVIIGGPVLPPETTSENTVNVVVSTVNDHLKINLKETDISVAHTLGSPQQQPQRQMIVKLTNRSLKYDLIGACMRVKPQLYINKNLAPNRKSVMNTILAIRKAH